MFPWDKPIRFFSFSYTLFFLPCIWMSIIDKREWWITSLYSFFYVYLYVYIVMVIGFWYSHIHELLGLWYRTLGIFFVDVHIDKIDLYESNITIHTVIARLTHFSMIYDGSRFAPKLQLYELFISRKKGLLPLLYNNGSIIHAR